MAMHATGMVMMDLGGRGKGLIDPTSLEPDAFGGEIGKDREKYIVWRKALVRYGECKFPGLGIALDHPLLEK